MKIDSAKVIFRVHALQRMFERHIDEKAVLQVLADGEVIEDYPGDTPYPSFLIAGDFEDRPIHIVASFNNDTGETIVITVYKPDPKKWEEDFKRRKL